MVDDVRFIICVGNGALGPETGRAARNDTAPSLEVGDITPVSARLLMQVGKTEVDLGLRPLDMTFAALLEQTPLLMPDAAEDIFTQWLWGDNREAARLYRSGLEESAYLPPRVVWRMEGDAAIRFPDLPVEALLGECRNAPAVYREVDACEAPLSRSMGRYPPPVGSWRVAPVSLIPRHLLPGQRDASREYDAIVRRQLPTLEVLDTEYALTSDRLAQLLIRLGEANVQVLHLIAGRSQDELQLPLQDGPITALRFAEMMSAGDWSELQLVVMSAQQQEGGSCGLAWSLMKMLPIPATICFQGMASPDTCVLPFVEQFYSALGVGRGVDEAVRHARVAMCESGEAGTADVLSPALYLRKDEDVPRIRPGDPGVEGILAAADAIAVARGIFEDPAVFQLAENIPAAVAGIHSRLTSIGRQHIARLRQNRDKQQRLVRHARDRTLQTYTASAAVADQLKTVLDMAPAPAGGEAGMPPAAPPGLDWVWVLRQTQDTGTITPAPSRGRLLHAPRAEPLWVTIEQQQATARVRLALCRAVEPIAFEDRGVCSAVFNISQWPPRLAAVQCIAEEDGAHLTQLERDLASASAAAVRRILRFHFRQLLTESQAMASFPGGLDCAELLRGGLRSLGIRAQDLPLPDECSADWPQGVHLLEDLDEHKCFLVALRPIPGGDMAENGDWERVRRCWRAICEERGTGSVVYLDTWPTAEAAFWEPAQIIEPSGTTSWVWDQLARAVGEYRQLLMQRLWEWWIGALPPENDNV